MPPRSSSRPPARSVLRAALLTATLGLALGGCGGDGSAMSNGTPVPAPTPTPTPTATGQVTVSGHQLLRDGAAYAPHGYFQVAFEAGSNVTPLTYEANANAGYTPQEYTDMAAAHADSVRLMISQPGADPQDSLYDSTLVPKVIAAVKAARAAGLTVVLGIQDEAVVGRSTRAGLPTDATLRVWQQLVPPFASDKGVLLELYNEPVITASQTIPAADWQSWATAFNTTIAGVRGFGATNVLVADGLDRAIILEGAPDLTDPMGQVAYAAHPYAFSDADKTTDFLDRSFGDFAVNHPVLITEYGLGYSCSALDPGFLVTFFHYLQDRGVGLEIGSWDWGGAGSFGNARYNFPAAPVFSRFYDNGTFQKCTSSTVTDGERGPGLTVNQWYTTGTIPAQAL